MASDSELDATQFLARSSQGDKEATAELVALVYSDLRARAARCLASERRDHTLEPTALVNEAYLRLVNQRAANLKSRTHFISVAAQEMRRVLIDHARARQAAKRGGGWGKVTLSAAVLPAEDRALDLFDLEEALSELSELQPRQCRVVELRFFGGLTVEEVAELLELSPKTVEKDWRMARSWIHLKLNRERGDESRGV